MRSDVDEVDAAEVNPDLGGGTFPLGGNLYSSTSKRPTSCPSLGSPSCPAAAKVPSLAVKGGFAVAQLSNESVSL